MSDQEPQPTGRVDDEVEDATVSDDEGAAARGEYDPAQGSPEAAHPVGQDYPDEAVRYDDPEGRPRSEPAE